MVLEDSLIDALMEVLDEAQKEALYVPFPISPSRTPLFFVAKIEKLSKRKGEIRI